MLTKMHYYLILQYMKITTQKLIGIIEYDGSQHFLPTTLYSDKKINAKEVLERTQRHDQIKIDIARKIKFQCLE